MKSPIAKLAVAAVIIIAVILGINHFMGPVNVTGVALADVLAKVEQAKAFMYKMRVTTSVGMFTGKPAETITIEMDYTITISNEYGTKWETETTDHNTGKTMTQIMYIRPGQKAAIMIMPEMKKYMQMEFDNELLARSKKQNNDPREMIKQIMGSQYTELGRSVIDGKEVEGFHTTDPAMLAGMGENIKCTLWVDAKSWLPVRCEMDFNMGEQMQASSVIYGYQWDIAVDARDFEPVIPDDFEPMATGMQMPKISEEGLIEGLRLFAELSGSYPKKLSMMELAQETMAFMTNRDVLEKIVEIIPEFRGLDEDELDKLDGHEVMMKTMQVTKPLQSPGFFYMMLVQDKKEPAYYGEKVSPGNVGLMLLRWKISDNQYRVIFGDLHAETVTLEKLAELEAALPK
jgi:outer membrane lipoprotein-sorting protein